MNTPVLLLTFANDRDAYLETLKVESRGIRQALESLEDKKLLKVHREESAELSAILHALNRFDGQIVLFHYGGHADGKGLYLEDEKGYSEGLAQLLSRQSNLQLVFLNGCSTKGQVERLLQLGIKVVIATITTIEDNKASQFAQNFYRKLANKGSIKQAFNFAADSLAFSHNNIRRPKITGFSSKRGMVNPELSDNDDSLQWGLYYLEETPEVLEWCLPSQPKSTIQPPDEGQAYEVNEYIYPVLGEMANYNQILAEQIEALEDEREYLDLIIKNFPWNIGSQISILVSTDPTMIKPQISRLEQIVSAYIACSQFLFYSLLSQAWDVRSLGQIEAIPFDLEESLGLHADNVRVFDHIAQFRKLMEVLQDRKVDLFIPEMHELYKDLIQQGDFFNAYLYLESIKDQLNEHQSDRLNAEIQSLCATSEYALSIILGKMAFLVNYLMITVRDIYLFNPRHREVEYQHQIGKVSAHSEDRVMMFRDLKPLHNSLDSSAIVLLKDLENPEERLNLTPFFIDKNAYGNKSASATDLYTFAFRKDPGAVIEEYYFLKSSHNFFRALEEELDQLHTGIEVEKETGRRELNARLRHVKKPQKIMPYLLLKEQFDHLKTLWQ